MDDASPLDETDRITGRALIEAERLRQVDEEEYDSEHDRMHGPEPLARAASCYHHGSQTGWPWAGGFFKPRDPLSNLIRAGALFLAASDVADPLYVGGDAHKTKRWLLDRADRCADEIDALLDKAREVLVTSPGQPPVPTTSQEDA